MAPSEIQLKPCPFCGGTRLLQTDKMVEERSEEEMRQAGLEPDAEEWFVVCGSCGAMGPMSPSHAEAQAAWSRRVD